MTDYKNMYSSVDLDTMRIAEESRLQGRNRIEEIISYAQKAGIKRIGIANCLSVQKEADFLRTKLSETFEVHSVDCKIGKLSSADLLGNNAKGISCNPVGQAMFLAQAKTELNISLGLCMGHDIVFNNNSQAPVTTLLVKDRQHKHNPYKEFEIL